MVIIIYLFSKHDRFRKCCLGKMKTSTTGVGIEFGPSIRAEISPADEASGMSRLGTSMSLPPLFSR